MFVSVVVMTELCEQPVMEVKEETSRVVWLLTYLLSGLRC